MLITLCCVLWHFIFCSFYLLSFSLRIFYRYIFRFTSPLAFWALPLWRTCQLHEIARSFAQLCRLRVIAFGTWLSLLGEVVPSARLFFVVLFWFSWISLCKFCCLGGSLIISNKWICYFVHFSKFSFPDTWFKSSWNATAGCNYAYTFIFFPHIPSIMEN